MASIHGRCVGPSPAGSASEGPALNGSPPKGSAPPDAPHDPDPDLPQMSHRQVMKAMSGLLLGMFVSVLSSTVVANALPQIIADLDGSQGSYTWVVTSTLLTMTASTPIWGKLADLVSKKLLLQSAVVIFVLASAGAGLSQNTGTLIAFRALQGIGAGGLGALGQVAMAAMVSPRQRGRYSGYFSATFTTATVGGPLLGGVITDTPWLGWRWCFYVGVPFGILALIVLQRTLNLPVIRQPGKRIDWLGALLVTTGVSLLLIWVTLAGDRYAWLSWQTAVMVGGSLLLGALFIWFETRTADPIIPLRLFRHRTVSIAAVASVLVGVAMFGGTVFFSQYFQLARGYSPTMSGILTFPIMIGMFIGATGSGLIVTRTGRWKIFLVMGGISLTAGFGLLGSMRHDTPYWQLAIFMALLGLGLGMKMQNLVLATQNQVTLGDLGAASSLIAFLRSLGGAIGVAALGAVLAGRITHYLRDGLAALEIRQPGTTSGLNGDGSAIQDPSTLPEPIRGIFQSASGHGIADIYLFAAPAALLGLLLVLYIRENPLQNASGMRRPD